MFDKDRSKNRKEAQVQEEVSVVEAREASERQEFTARSVSYFGPGMQLSGDVTVAESLVIEGTFDGNVTSTDENLTVGKKGRVKGELHGIVVSVRGTVEGKIYGDKVVRLYPTAVVDGTVYCERLIIDDGATFNGNIDMAAENAATGKAKLTSVDAGEPVSKVAG
jgi:cytoskeletal protein CcmA (bactofilin family)